MLFWSSLSFHKYLLSFCYVPFTLLRAAGVSEAALKGQMAWLKEDLKQKTRVKQGGKGSCPKRCRSYGNRSQGGTLTLKKDFSSNHGTVSSCPLSPRCSAQRLARDECSVNPQRMDGFVEGVTLRNRWTVPLSQASREKGGKSQTPARNSCWLAGLVKKRRLSCLRADVWTQFKLHVQQPTDFYPLGCTGTS